jgi:hypothetical protein
MTELNILTPAIKTSCINQTLSNSLELCVSATCTVKESLSMLPDEHFGKFLRLAATKNITAEFCDWPLRNRTNTVSITAIAGLVLAILAVLLRLLSRMKSKQPGMDDWTIIVVMVCRQSKMPNPIAYYNRYL